MWKLTFIFFITYTILLSAQNSSSRNISSLESGLASFSGSYELKKGQPERCPEGEFTGHSNEFVVGSDFKISNINKPGNWESNDSTGNCKNRTSANYDGKTLHYTKEESCKNGNNSKKEHTFEFYIVDGTKMIKVSFKNFTKLEGSHKSTLEYTCLFQHKPE